MHTTLWQCPSNKSSISVAMAMTTVSRTIPSLLKYFKSDPWSRRYQCDLLLSIWTPHSCIFPAVLYLCGRSLLSFLHSLKAFEVLTSIHRKIALYFGSRIFHSSLCVLATSTCLCTKTLPFCSEAFLRPSSPVTTMQFLIRPFYSDL